MGRKGKRITLALLLIAALLGAVGCESVGGVNLNKSLVEAYDTVSAEGTFSVSWEFTRDESQPLEEDLEMLMERFGSGKLAVTESKTESATALSAKGTLELPEATLPFELYFTGTDLIVDVEGAKLPIEFSAYPEDNSALYAPLSPAELQAAFDPNSEEVRSLNRALASFIIGNFSNPERTETSRVTEEIDGESTRLTKVTFELNVAELIESGMEFALRAVQDEEGLRALIGAVYDAYLPVMKAYLAEIEETGEEPPMADMIRMAVGSKQLSVEMVYEQLRPMLEAAKEQLENPSLQAEMLAAEFGEESGMTVSWLFDGMYPIGSDVTVVLAPPANEDNSGISSFRLDMSSRMWNVNGDVKADTYTGETYRLSDDIKPRDRLENFDQDSYLYDLLKNEFHVTKESFNLYMGDDATVTDGTSPYIAGAGTTMVPVRYVSEQLDAGVHWNPETYTVTITDTFEGVVIQMTVNEKTAFVNGEAVELPEAPAVHNGSAFVPIAFITNALGGTAEWDPEWGIVTITKEF